MKTDALNASWAQDTTGRLILLWTPEGIVEPVLLDGIPAAAESATRDCGRPFAADAMRPNWCDLLVVGLALTSFAMMIAAFANTL